MHLAQSAAQSESESIYENIKWTYKNRAREGKFWAKPGVYYGYDSKGDSFTENADADNVRFMFDRFIEGATITQIAKELNEKGCRTVRGNEWTMDAVKAMRVLTVMQIGMQDCCAVSFDADYTITANIKDFEGVSKGPAITPIEFLAKI